MKKKKKVWIKKHTTTSGNWQKEGYNLIKCSKTTDI